MDVGRVPVARFPSGDVKLAADEITFDDIDAAVSMVRDPDARPSFGDVCRGEAVRALLQHPAAGMTSLRASSVASSLLDVPRCPRPSAEAPSLILFGVSFSS